MYTVCAAQALDRPGLYMDAVNPDYLVVKMLHPDAPTEYWLPPGNLFLGRIPILSGMYSGSFTVYVLAPFYALFGASLGTLRWAHLCTGLAIVAAMFVFVRAATQSLTIATAICGVMAVDPAFILPFRTQANITILPIFFALLGLYALVRHRTVRGYFVAGVLLGLATFGYFVFGFLLPGIAVFSLTDPPQRRKAMGLAAGVAVGLLPYAFGYGLLIGTLGLDGAVAWIRHVTALLHIDSHQSYFERAQSVIDWSWLVLDGGWDQLTFWGNDQFDATQGIKAWALVLVPLAAVPFALRPLPAAHAFRLTTLSTLSFIVVATILGQRLGGHDLTPLLPLLYACTAVGLGLIATRLPARANRWAFAAGVTGCAVLVAVNVHSSLAFTAKLQRDGSQGLYSSVFSDYPVADALAHDRTPHVFCQWGALFQYIYLTDGQIPSASGGGLKPSLCTYGKAKVVLTGTEVLAHPDIDFAKLGAVVGRTEILHDASSGFPYAIIDVTPTKTLCGVTPAVAAAPTRAVATATAPAVAAAPAATDALVLPAGIAPQDEPAVSGIYPSKPGQCCFIAGTAHFPVGLPPGARRLRFTVYPPAFVRIAPQRLTFWIDGRAMKRTPVLAKGITVPIDVDLPGGAAGWRPVVHVMITASTAFIPKDLDISPDVRTLSVVLFSVEPQP